MKIEVRHQTLRSGGFTNCSKQCAVRVCSIQGVRSLSVGPQ
jgi:hypothetical protein